MAEWQTRTFEGRMGTPCEFKSHWPHQKNGTYESKCHFSTKSVYYGKNPLSVRVKSLSG